MRLAAVLSGALTVALGMYLCNSDYTRKIHVVGRITPSTGSIRAVTPQAGLVVRRHVREGDSVRSGQVLYELSSERTAESGGIDSQIDASLKVRRGLLQQERKLQTQQLQQRAKSLQERRHLTVVELARLDQEIAVQSQRVSSAATTVGRYRVLRDQNFVSEFQLTQYENDHSDQISRRDLLVRARLGAARDLVATDAELDQIDVQVQLSSAQAERALASLEQEAAEHHGRSRIQVLAPVTGTVTALTAETGQSVGAFSVLATVIPTNSILEAHLVAPSRAIGFVKTGQPVLLRISAFPYQKFGQVKGTVISVENSPFVEAGGNEQETKGPTGTEPLYRIVVKLAQQSVDAYGQEQTFKAGMTLEADISQEKRRLIRWILDPILAVSRGGKP
jgi:membrane fusion protein